MKKIYIISPIFLCKMYKKIRHFHLSQSMNSPSKRFFSAKATIFIASFIIFCVFACFGYILFTILLYNINKETDCEVIFMYNTKKRTNRIGFLLPLFYLVAPTLATLRSIACINDIDPGGIGYFGDSTLMKVCNIAVAIFTIIFFTHAFSHYRKDSVPHESFCNTPTYIVSGVLGVAICFAIFEMASSLFGSDGSLDKISGEKIIFLVGAILGVAALAFLLMNALIEKKHSVIRAAMGIASSAFFTAYGICVYFDNSVAANIQQRILTLLSLIFTAAFMLYEARIPLGRSKWHSYAAFGFMASLLLLYAGVPEIAYVIAKGAFIPGATVIQLGVMIASAIYIITRVSLMAFMPEDEVCDLADSILDMAHRRG